MKLNSKIVVPAAIVAVLAAGGSAFTASNTLPSNTVAGYGSTSVTGATATSISYSLDSTGANIAGETVVFSGDLTGKTVQAAWDAANLSSCTLAAYDSANDATTATCTAPAATDTASAFHVAVTS